MMAIDWFSFRRWPTSHEVAFITEHSFLCDATNRLSVNQQTPSYCDVLMLLGDLVIVTCLACR